MLDVSLQEFYTARHEAFSASRTESFPVAADERSLELLNDLERNIGEESRSPIVFVGEEGSGKTTLLATWAKRLQERNHTVTSSTYNEETNWNNNLHSTKKSRYFIFQHYSEACCKSRYIQHFLIRLICSLKRDFELHTLGVRRLAPQLITDLPIFLEAAGRKENAKIVIILDGVDDMVNEDGSSISPLYWLPKHLPLSVRFVLSCHTKGRSKEAWQQHVYFHSLLSKTTKFYVNGCGGRKTPPKDPSPECLKELVQRGCFAAEIVHFEAHSRRLILQQLQKNNEVNDYKQEELIENILVPGSSKPVWKRPLFLRCIHIVLQFFRILNPGSSSKLFRHCKNISILDSEEDVLNYFFDLVESSVEIREDGLDKGMVGHIMGLIALSRHGLSDADIISCFPLCFEKAEDRVVVTNKEHWLPIKYALDQICFYVRGLRVLSHRIFGKVIWNRYIRNNELKRQYHLQLASYFDPQKRSVTDRVIEELFWHLENSNSWTVLKKKFISVEFFRRFNTQRYIEDFYRYWDIILHCNLQSLSKSIDKTKSTRQKEKNKNAPTDIIKELFNSTEAYIRKGLKANKDTQSDGSANLQMDQKFLYLLLEIGDFLYTWESITNMEEKPDFFHPRVPKNAINSLNVKLNNDIELEPCDVNKLLMKQPVRKASMIERVNRVRKKNKEKIAKYNLNEDKVMKMTFDGIKHKPKYYYYMRWMWIQFPFISLLGASGRVQSALDSISASEKAVNFQKSEINAYSLDISIPMAGSKDKEKRKRAYELRNAVSTPSLSFASTPSISKNQRLASVIKGMSKQQTDCQVGKSAVAVRRSFTVPKLTQQRSATQRLKDTNERLRNETIEIKRKLNEIAHLRQDKERLLEQLKDESNRSLQEESGMDATFRRKLKYEEELDQLALKQSLAEGIKEEYELIFDVCRRFPPGSKAALDSIELEVEKQAKIIKVKQAARKKAKIETKRMLEQRNIIRTEIRSILKRCNEVTHRLRDEHELTALESKLEQEKKKKRIQARNEAHEKFKRELEKKLNSQSVTTMIVDAEQLRKSEEIVKKWRENWKVIKAKCDVQSIDELFERWEVRNDAEERLRGQIVNLEQKYEDLKNQLVQEQEHVEAYACINEGRLNTPAKSRVQALDDDIRGAAHRTKKNHKVLYNIQTLINQTKLGIFQITSMLGLDQMTNMNSMLVNTGCLLKQMVLLVNEDSNMKKEDNVTSTLSASAAQKELTGLVVARLNDAARVAGGYTVDGKKPSLNIKILLHSLIRCSAAHGEDDFTSNPFESKRSHGFTVDSIRLSPEETDSLISDEICEEPRSDEINVTVETRTWEQITSEDFVDRTGLKQISCNQKKEMEKKEKKGKRILKRQRTKSKSKLRRSGSLATL